MTEEVKNEYPCSQKDLYSILETAWQNFDEHQTDFASLKALYTVAYGSIAKDEIATAKALPDNQARGEVAESLRVQLISEGDTCRKNFQKIKSYIVTAYPNKALHKAKFDAAGQLYYEGASNQDWESVSMLNQNGSNYINANSVDLLAGANMPVGFLASYDADAATFLATYNSFKTAEQTSETTAKKINANNSIYRTTTGMLKDGQLIFAAKPEVSVKYVFQSLWELVNPSVAGIKGNVKQALDNLPLKGVTITTQQTGEPVDTVETDELGNFSLRLAVGTYQVIVSMVGYVSQSVRVIIPIGSYKTVDFSLVVG